MTKKVRIENADTSTNRLRVHVEYLVDGAWVRSADQLPARSEPLRYPADLAELWVHGQQRLVVEEDPTAD